MTTSRSMPSIGPDHPQHIDKFIRVAAGVVENDNGEILIAKRPTHLHQGGLWEFPGGKLEADEDALRGLRRELHEEVNISIESATPLIQIPWHYADKSIMLDVMYVTDYSGLAKGLEGQTIKWVKRNELAQYAFPTANQSILKALILPERYMITGKFDSADEFMVRLQRALVKGIKLVQLRVRDLADDALIELVRLAKALCEQHAARLLVNSNVALAEQLDVDIHMNSALLMRCQKRPLFKHRLVGASVHNQEELQQANRLGVDFIVISPVLPTDSHPGETTLGWETFSHLVSQASVPVYALGGVSEKELGLARQAGAQGIAAISAFW